MNGVYGSEQAHVDWKVLGLMLGLSHSTLEKIQSRMPDGGFEKAMLRHWIELGIKGLLFCPCSCACRTRD